MVSERDSPCAQAPEKTRPSCFTQTLHRDSPRQCHIGAGYWAHRRHIGAGTVLRVASLASFEERLALEFKEADKNGDNTLSLSEVRALVHRVNITLFEALLGFHYELEHLANRTLNITQDSVSQLGGYLTIEDEGVSALLSPLHVAPVTRLSSP